MIILARSKRKRKKIKDIGISYMALAGMKEQYDFPRSQICRPNTIEKLVCDYYGQTIDNLRKSDRRRAYVTPRQIIMFLLRKYTKMSHADIGELYHRDHSTVVHSVDVVMNLMDTEPAYKKEVQFLESKIYDAMGIPKSLPEEKPSLIS